ncbi:MAG: CoA-transferase [Arenicellales bacterium]|nr:CoA-transferase [Arenicellales bacterium]
MAELKEKVCSLGEAAALIPDGARIAIGGFAMHNHPMAFVHELIRRRVRNLTTVGHVNGIELDLLVGAGCVKRVETSYVGLEEFGLAPAFRRASENGELELREYSEMVAFGRFMCSSRGESFFPSIELMGTDLPKHNPDIREGVNPLDGSKYHAIPAAEPEWVVLHAPMGDRYGNILYFGNRQMPLNLDLVLSRCTTNLIVTVEQLVSREHVYRLSEYNAIPRFRTHAIVEVPYGAHPSSCLQLYEHDKQHLRMYADAARGTEGLQEYLARYIYGVDTHMEYLDLVGVESLVGLRVVGGNL